MSIRSAIKKLAARGVDLPDLSDEAIEMYLKYHHGLRSRVNGLWKEAKDTLASNPGICLGLRNRLGLNSSLSPERWKECPGKLLGAINFKRVNAALVPNSLNRHGFTPLIFKGPFWGDVVMTPFYNQPDQICGFGIVGRKGEKEDRLVKYHGNSTCKEGGLAGLPSVEMSNGMFGESVVAMSDHWLMLKLQMRHFAGSMIPMPLVAWNDNGHRVTKNAWRSLSNRRMVFWVHDEVLTAQTLHQAIITNGSISITRMQTFDKHATDHYIRNNEPRDIMRKLIKRAQPWRDALRDWAETVADGVIEDTLHGLTDYGHSVQEIAAISPRLRSLVTLPTPELKVQLGRMTVVEKDGKWWSRNVKGDTRILMNATMRVDAMVVKKDVTHYKGRILFEGQEIPFEVPMSAMRHYAPDKIRDAVARATGKSIYIASAVRGGLIDAATAFSNLQNDAALPL